MGHWHVHNDLIEAIIKDGGTMEKLVKSVDIRAFYNELHDVLVAKNFKDIFFDPDSGDFFNHQTKAGEFTNNKENLNRKGDMYEIKFTKVINSDVTELEFVWKCKKKAEFSNTGWFEVKIDLTSRNIKDIEIVNGSSKKVLQFAGWEFRNEILYKNNVIKKKLNKIPFVKNSEIIKDLYINHMYAKTLESDIHFGEHKIYGLIYGVINKYFK